MYQTGYYATGYYQTGYYSRTGGAVPTPAALFTYQLLVYEARILLGDTEDGFYRYSDAMLLSILNRGLNDLNRIRPDAWYEYYGQYTDGVPEVTDAFITLDGEVNWEAGFQPPVQFYPAMVDYVVGFINMMEDDLVNKGSAMRFYQSFKNKVLAA